MKKIKRNSEEGKNKEELNYSIPSAPSRLVSFNPTSRLSSLLLIFVDSCK
jgi:hypothetical protein